ncbi:MAG: YicC/YloC family endoribonuclease [Bacteroidales bacterium]|nr:YicC/YloC family endoribonuclease [Bacteroidales bacterium]
MIYSMTGFGRGIASAPNKKITVEIKSLNSKQLDLSMRVPGYFRELEVEVRNEILRDLERGKVDLVAQVENTAPEAQSSVNIEVLASYKKQLEEAASVLGVSAPADWFPILMRMPESMKTQLQALDDADVAAFKEACRAAIERLAEFRATEGRKLYAFFKEKTANIALLLEQVEPFEKDRVSKIRERLETQLSRLSSIEYDKGRLEQELIFYIEKLDVTEEKIRLRSHINYFLETMGGEDERPAGGQGKKLGFIAQEMGREINTLGSKSNDAEMQKIVVKMKDELEQIKEQVLNVL